jgi:hypothetical protein
MTYADKFMDQFDEDGRFTKKDGVVSVVFHGTNQRFPGELHFTNGLCVRATMEAGGDWGYPDNTPLAKVHFLLDFDGEPAHGILVDDGRVVAHYDKGRPKL